MFFCIRFSMLCFVFLLPLYAVADGVTLSKKSSSTQELSPGTISVEVKAIGKENIALIMGEKSEILQEGMLLSSAEKELFEVKSIDGSLLIVRQLEGPSLVIGKKLVLMDESERKVALEKLQKYEQQELSKRDKETLVTDRSILDQDYFLSEGQFSLNFNSELILKETTSGSNSTGTVTATNDTKGWDIGLATVYSPVDRLLVYAKFNYVPRKTNESASNLSSSQSSSYKGIDDPEFGAAYRIKERERHGDYSATMVLKFKPSFFVSKTTPAGDSTPARGYAITDVSGVFGWKWSKHEFLLTPKMIFVSGGSSTGENGAKHTNYNSSFVYGVTGKYQVEMSKKFRPNASLGILFPYTREYTVLDVPQYSVKAEQVAQFLFGIGATATPFKSDSIVINLNIDGLIPTGDADLSIHRAGSTNTITGKGHLEYWKMKFGIGKVF